MTTLGKLFFDIGTKGSEKSAADIDKVSKGLKNTSSMALETKAAIIAALYALDRMSASAFGFGTSVNNTSLSLGMQTQELMRYEKAAKLANSSVEEMDGTLRGLQKTAKDTAMGGGLPANSFYVQNKVGGMTSADFKHYADDPGGVSDFFQTLQKYMLAEKNPAQRNMVGQSMGLPQRIVDLMSQGKFTPDKLASMPNILSDNMVKDLSKGNEAVARLKDDVETAMQKLVAQYGPKLVKDITPLIDKILTLSNALMKLSDHIGVFKLIGDAIQGWTYILSGMVEVIDYLNAKDGQTIDPKWVGTGNRNTAGEYVDAAGIPKRISGASSEVKQDYLKREKVTLDEAAFVNDMKDKGIETGKRVWQGMKALGNGLMEDIQSIHKDEKPVKLDSNGKPQAFVSPSSLDGNVSPDLAPTAPSGASYATNTANNTYSVKVDVKVDGGGDPRTIAAEIERSIQRTFLKLPNGQVA